MDREIERKFFFSPNLWSAKALKSTVLEQGYLADTGAWEIRLRRAGSDCHFTVKKGVGLDREEWETRPSGPEFEALWGRTEGQRLVKVREKYGWKGLTVDVDRYGGKFEDLVVAEVEFPDLEQARRFVPPRAFGPELTYDPRYKNRALAGGRDPVPRGFPGGDDQEWAFGVVPFRRGPRGLEVVIVSTRRGDRWIFPKGQPETGIPPVKVALAEAREEAGLTGRVVGHPIVVPYVRETGTINLLLFPFQVTAVADRWLETGQRERKILPLGEAPAHGEVIRLGVEMLVHQFGTVGS